MNPGGPATKKIKKKLNDIHFIHSKIAIEKHYKRSKTSNRLLKSMICIRIITFEQSYLNSFNKNNKFYALILFN